MAQALCCPLPHPSRAHGTEPGGARKTPGLQLGHPEVRTPVELSGPPRAQGSHHGQSSSPSCRPKARSGWEVQGVVGSLNHSPGRIWLEVRKKPWDEALSAPQRPRASSSARSTLGHAHHHLLPPALLPSSFPHPGAALPQLHCAHLPIHPPTTHTCTHTACAHTRVHTHMHTCSYTRTQYIVRAHTHTDTGLQREPQRLAQAKTPLGISGAPMSLLTGLVGVWAG